MPTNCNALDDLKNSEFIAIYEDKYSKIEIVYSKHGIEKALTLEIKFVVGMGHFLQFVEISDEPILKNKTPLSLNIWDIEKIKDINILYLTPSYDRTQKVEIIFEAKTGSLLKLSIYPTIDDEEDCCYFLEQTTTIYKKECYELFSMDSYKKHLAIALKAHGSQLTPHGLPYSFHIISVATEIINVIVAENLSKEEADITIGCALLHDVLEDTTYLLQNEDINPKILDGVKALTKDKNLPKELQMADSLKRLKKLPRYIQMVKLADRITNLGVPPEHWGDEKKKSYQEEARVIQDELRSPEYILNLKLEDKIDEYNRYIKEHK